MPSRKDSKTRKLTPLRKRNPNTKVVFVSGYAEEAFRKNLPEGEEFHFLPKPFTMKQLVETVKAAISQALFFHPSRQKQAA